MKKTFRLGILFTQPPFGSSASREGLDALLAASAFCNEQELVVFFLNDGVFNLLANQQPEIILQKDHIAMFKLLELYEINQCMVCQESVEERGLQNKQWLLPNLQFVSRSALLTAFAQVEKLLTF